MGWRGRRGGWPERPSRPKVKRLSAEEKNRILSTLENKIGSSPVLCALNIRVRSLRGRFYFERVWTDTMIETIGRATPLEKQRITLLLEVERGRGGWYRITEGGPKKIVEAIANDDKGTFHGLGALDRNLRQSNERQSVEMDDDLTFRYSDTHESCTTQEALFHFFGLPINVIAEPKGWYKYHRKPGIIETSGDRTKILVRFSSMSAYGSFEGICLYAIIDGKWDAFTIRPNQSRNIKSAMAWLEKRNWKDWG